jgi:KRAB domain-containing zinc finger protein
MKSPNLMEGSPLLCSICGKVFTTESQLQGHNLFHIKVERHTGEKPTLQCDKCLKLFYSKMTLLVHFKKTHIERRGVMICKLCPRRVFRKPALFEDHQRLHLPITACECLRCGLALGCYNELLDHAFEKHRDVPNSLDVKCVACKKVFITPAGLRHHLLSSHLDRLQECKICGKAFTQKPALKMHMWTHKEDCTFPFWCKDPNCTFRARCKQA